MEHNQTSESWTKEDQQASEPDFYGRWVELRKEAPSQGQKVLISDGENIGHAQIVFNACKIVASNDLVRLDTVTHWMSLPEPPNMGDRQTNGFISFDQWFSILKKVAINNYDFEIEESSAADWQEYYEDEFTPRNAIDEDQYAGK